MSKVSIKDIKGSENPNQVLQTDANGDPFYGPPPSSGWSAWGAITGTLSAQTDLQTVLDDIEILALAGL